MPDSGSEKSGGLPRPPEPSWAVHALVKISEKLGVSAGLLSGIVATVFLLGGEKTKDQFVREILFGGTVNGTPWLRIIVAMLALFVLLGGTSVFRFLSTDSKEMKRMAAEKAALQEQLLGRQLHHTDSAPDLQALPLPTTVDDEGAEENRSSAVARGDVASGRSS